MSAGCREKPIPPGIPGPVVLVPLIAGRVRSVLVIWLRKGKRSEIWSHFSSTGSWHGARLGLGLRGCLSSSRLLRLFVRSSRRAHIRPAFCLASAMTISLHYLPLRFRVAGGSNRSRPRRAVCVTACAATRLMGDAERFLVVVRTPCWSRRRRRTSCRSCRRSRGADGAPLYHPLTRGGRGDSGGCRPPVSPAAFRPGTRGAGASQGSPPGAFAPDAMMALWAWVLP